MQLRVHAIRLPLCAALCAGLLSTATAGSAVAGPAAAASARTFDVGDGKLAFTATRRGPDDWQIYVRRPSGGHPRAVSRPRWTNIDPAWSPDGSLIAYARSIPGGDDQLVVAKGSGEGIRVVVDASSSGLVDMDRPSWSPDGSALTFQAFDPALGQQIFRVNADGSGLERLTDLPEYAAPEDPAWSPAGGTIAFDAWSGPDEDAWTDIYLMDTDGSDVHLFTDDKALDFNPTFSPSGSALLWSRQDRQIVTENVDGSGFRTITSSHDFNAEPTWAPGGDWIAFVSNRPACDGCVTSYNVFLMTPSGGDIHPVTHTVGVQYLSPSWRRSSRSS